MPNARAYCFTSWKPLTFAYDYNKTPSDKVRYMVAQVEKCPTTGQLHVQGYIELTEPMSIGQVKKIIHDDKAHLSQRKGTPEEVSKRCFCEDCTKICLWTTKYQKPWIEYYLPVGPYLLHEGGHETLWGWSVGADGVGRLERF